MSSFFVCFKFKGGVDIWNFRNRSNLKKIIIRIYKHDLFDFKKKG